MQEITTEDVIVAQQENPSDETCLEKPEEPERIEPGSGNVEENSEDLDAEICQELEPDNSWYAICMREEEEMVRNDEEGLTVIDEELEPDNSWYAMCMREEAEFQNEEESLTVVNEEVPETSGNDTSSREIELSVNINQQAPIYLDDKEDNTYQFVETYPAPWKYVKLLKALGEGRFGVLHKGWHLVRNRQVTIEIIKDMQDEEKILQEIEILEMVYGHDNIIKFHGAYYHKASRRTTTNTGLWIAMEMCAGGSVYDLMGTKKQYSLGERWISYICREVLQGLCHLQKLKIIHHDLKPENLMLTKYGDVKIVNFEHATIGEKSDSSAGTVCYMAPEALGCLRKSAEYDYKADIWSLGITAIAMAQGYPPYSNEPEKRVIKKIIFGQAPVLTWDRWSDTFHSFVDKCLQKNPNKRPTAEKLLLHPFITDIGDVKGVKWCISKHLE
uniref:Protein kinase domain-containing protein n=1 Tax=Xenopus tropicalis TaxID=8364 RepID=A0A803JQC3_XENTR